VVEGFQKFAAGDKVRPLSWAEAGASVDTTATFTATDAKQTTQAHR
jgi:hypothetical protein